MIKTILLLTPVYITLFWAVVLHTDKKKQSEPRRFLGKFMIAAFAVYVSHFIFYSQIIDLYLIIDPFYQFVSLLVYPMYHIYFRLLTVDAKFSIKKHGIYLLAPTLIFVLYLVGILLSNHDELEFWIKSKDIASNSKSIQYLEAIRFVIRILYIIQIVFVIIANTGLIRKYKSKTIDFYSDIDDIRSIRIKLLNYTMIITAISSIVLTSLGKNYFENKDTALTIAAVIFSSMLFIIGWLGDRQKPLNPAFEKEEKHQEKTKDKIILEANEKLLAEKITTLLEKEKVYLNSKLNIIDIASKIGTNRSYISSLINKKFDQNFCCFVNQYRIKELEQRISNEPNTSYHILAEECGFGSVDSMKRSVKAKTGMNMKEWKESFR